MKNFIKVTRLDQKTKVLINMNLIMAIVSTTTQGSSSKITFSNKETFEVTETLDNISKILL